MKSIFHELDRIPNQRSTEKKLSKLEIVSDDPKLHLQLPPEVFQLKHLRSLILHGLDIPEFPEQFGEFTELEELRLSWCRSARLPPALGKTQDECSLQSIGHSRKVQDAKGRFAMADLAEIWASDRYPQSRHAELLQLMIKFELCFPLGSSGVYVAPELLSAEMPQVNWESSNNLVFEYHYHLCRQA